MDGYLFDSRKEANRYWELKMLERAGQISGLRMQVPFELIPAQRDMKGKVVERACVYRADFVYEENGKTIVEDVKSPATRTPEYRIKRKLMRWLKRIEVREV